MRFQRILLTGGLALVLTGWQGCDDDGSGTSKLCAKWCDTLIAGESDCAEDQGCWIEDVNDYEADCVEECIEGLDDLDSDERKEAVDCLECEIDEAGDSPDCVAWSAAEQACASECNNDGAEEFLDEHNANLHVSCSDADADADTDF